MGFGAMLGAVIHLVLAEEAEATAAERATAAQAEPAGDVMPVPIDKAA
jgi:hypothetical protein